MKVIALKLFRSFEPLVDFHSAFNLINIRNDNQLLTFKNVKICNDEKRYKINDAVDCWISNSPL